MMKQVSLFIFSIFILVGSAYDENTIEEAKKKVSEGLDMLPDNVKEIIPKGLDPDKIPSIEEGEDLLKERCLRYGTNTSFDQAMAAKEDLQFCLRGLVNTTVIKKEIELAKPTGDLDIVFRKYCRKSPMLRNCVTNFTEAIEPCLSPEELGTKQTITNITDALISFICFKEGDRIALFIAEGGPDCLQSKYEDIVQCLNSTFSKYTPKETLNPEALKDELPQLKLGQPECNDIKIFQKCVVKHLEQCSEPTPANIVDSMFTFVKKVTPCQQYEVKAGASSTHTSVVTVALAAAASILISTLL
ncbi:27 kDa glycoprotein-like [Macrosteles quadrilineatus]|uniref:27 kDa glycoprotein-like n=1 Tax=Macrosteles quadrilineatus TaxID=74068 RepID=UPI0023E16797|nr:27 kDa glycoprotein-like [Macrosteles quadrilineatus]XP_054288161.1 27 kDa glycoprotein-like [Macrosteles quadrilineatus]